MKKVIIVTGQTATGKTSYAVQLAREHNGELVNADSRQIYKYLDIITGKDLEHPHYLYDLVAPDQYFSSFDYVQAAIPVLKKILADGKTPIIVGGTYLYLKHLLYGVDTENIQPDWELRNELNNKSVEELQQKLKNISMEMFERLNESDRMNPQRLIRRIEILTSSTVIASDSEAISLSLNTTGLQRSLRSLAMTIGIEMDIEFIGLKFKNKKNIMDIITERVAQRMKNGAFEEVKKLLTMNYTENDPGLKTIGYQQLIHVCKGTQSLNEALNEWTTREVQYAKRQLTFMKKDPNIQWKEV